MSQNEPQLVLQRVISRLFVAIVVLSASRRSVCQVSNVESAKQHYQKAAAAIEKSDWLTAKGELLQAEKLAPNNAIVHYDLALAYSHTGRVRAAQDELNLALRLGLPSAQATAAQELRQQLRSSASTVTAHGTGSRGNRSDPTFGASASDVKHIAAMNEAIREAGATSTIYRPGGFTLETSTGTLWWTRDTDKYCANSSPKVVQASVSIRLSEANANLISDKNSDGTSDLYVECGEGSTCMEDWAYDKCLAMEDWRWGLGTNDYPDIVDRFDKVQTHWRDGVKSENHGPLKFFPFGDNRLTIELTGNETAMSALTTNFKQLILDHGGKEVAIAPPPPAPPPVTQPSYDETVSWIQSKFSMLGRVRGRPLTYTFSSMYNCSLQYSYTIEYPDDPTYTDSVTIPLANVKEVTQGNGGGVYFASNTQSITKEHRGKDYALGYIELTAQRNDVDNQDLVPRMVKAFQNAVSICKSKAPKSNEPF